MLRLNKQSKIIVFPKPINFHKSFDALTDLVANELKIELEPHLFILFSNARKNRIKILHHDGQHLVISAARFEHALYFSFKNTIVFNSVSFHEFLNTPNPRRRINRIKKS